MEFQAYQQDNDANHNLKKSNKQKKSIRSDSYSKQEKEEDKVSCFVKVFGCGRTSNNT